MPTLHCLLKTNMQKTAYCFSPFTPLLHVRYGQTRGTPLAHKPVSLMPPPPPAPLFTSTVPQKQVFRTRSLAPSARTATPPASARSPTAATATPGTTATSAVLRPPPTSATRVTTAWKAHTRAHPTPPGHRYQSTTVALAGCVLVGGTRRCVFSFACNGLLSFCRKRRHCFR